MQQNAEKMEMVSYPRNWKRDFSTWLWISFLVELQLEIKNVSQDPYNTVKKHNKCFVIVDNSVFMNMSMHRIEIIKNWKQIIIINISNREKILNNDIPWKLTVTWA